MTRVVASLAAVVALLGLAACDDDGAEPGASREATLVLDFTPNAVHAPLYLASASGALDGRELELEIREPSSSSDAPKLLEAGRADLAIMDINDFGIARARGLRLRALAALVQVPLAAVIARDREAVRTPSDLEGRTVGVTGLPSDDAVLDAVVAADGGDARDVDRVNIGFDSVAALTSGRVDAATAFWNAEGVALRDAGIPTRELRVEDSLRRPFPELVIVAAERTARNNRDLIAPVVDGVQRGVRLLVADPGAGIDALTAAVPELDRDAQERQLDALLGAEAFGRRPTIAISRAARNSWLRFAIDGGVIPADARERVARGFGLRG